MKSQKALKY